MAIEDFTGYTEVDPLSHVTVTASKIDFAGITRSEDTYVYDNKGVDFFGTTYEHQYDFILTDSTLTGTAQTWCLANTVNNLFIV